MRGSPILRVALVLAALLALIVPLRHLTAPRQPPPSQPAAEVPGHLATLRLALTSTAAPFHYEISHLGAPVWSGDATGHEATTDLAIPFPKEGIDLLIEASWESSGPAALKVEATRGDETMMRTLWGSGNTSEVVTFP